VFEKFYRGEPSHGSGGVGLGLTVCRGIVEAHGGRIRALDRPGGGALFVFTLPLSAETPIVEAEAQVQEETPGTGVAP
jgi:two-component system sensor histidine kinase KdpD